ncbi:MAG: hypothetical protein P3A33_09865 [Gemmatimonadota bacterium]|nr:hypothetical protein [Gemmatimonadota bacterium]
MALPLDGALYISNPRRKASSSPDVLNGLGDLMAITISNPLLMNRMSKRQARAHAKSMKRSKNGRFLPRRKAAKRRASKLTAAKRRQYGRKGQTSRARRSASRRRAKKMSAAQLEKLIRRYGYVADVRRPKKRRISKEHQAKMQSQKKVYGAHRKTRAELGTIQGPLFMSGAFEGDASNDVKRGGVNNSGMSYEDLARLEAAAGRGNPRRNRRNRVRRNGRRNPSGFAPFDMIERGLNATPFTRWAVPYATPVLVGATVGAVHYFAVKQLIGPAVEMINPTYLGGLTGYVKTAAERGAYTIGGVAVATALQVKPLANALSSVGISRELQFNLALGAVIVGGALDAYRYLKGDAATAYGDGTAYKVVPFGGLSYGGLDYSGVHTATRHNPIIMGRPNPIEMGGLSYGSPVDMGGLSYGSPSLNGIVYAGEGM